MLLTDSIAPLISRIDIDEFKPLDFHEIEALVEYFAQKKADALAIVRWSEELWDSQW